MASSPNAVDAAVIAALAGDPQLATLLPDGVFMTTAAPNATRFVIVDPQAHEDTPGMGAPLYERYQYLVRAVCRSTDGNQVMAAADRIHAVLEAEVLTVTGYTHMATTRTARDRGEDIDPVDSDMRWQHRGGTYEVFVSPD